MTKFILLAFVWSSGSPTWQTYEVQGGLTGAQCIELLLSNPQTAHDDDGNTVDIHVAELACELEAH